MTNAVANDLDYGDDDDDRRPGWRSLRRPRPGAAQAPTHVEHTGTGVRDRPSKTTSRTEFEPRSTTATRPAGRSEPMARGRVMD